MLAKLNFIVLLGILSVASTSPVPGVEDPELRLNQGTNSVPGQFPYAVGIEIVNNVFCGGSILNEWHVLTSASCVINNGSMFLLSPTLMNVRAGAGVVENVMQSVRRPVQAIYVHPQYNPLDMENNLAVLRMRDPFQFTNIPLNNIIVEAPVELNSRIVGDTTPCQVVGWNTNTVNPPQQFINAPISNRDTCNNLVPHLRRILERMVCAGVVTAGPGVCLSDNGAGLYCNGRLTGILSFGFGCGVANTPGVYTQVRYYSDWINDQFNRQDIPSAGPISVAHDTHPVFNKLNNYE